MCVLKDAINTATCSFKLQELKQTNLHGSHECTSALCNFRGDIGGVLRAQTRQHIQSMHTSACCKCRRIASIACCTREKQKLMHAHHSSRKLVTGIRSHYVSKVSPCLVCPERKEKAQIKGGIGWGRQGSRQGRWQRPAQISLGILPESKVGNILAKAAALRISPDPPSVCEVYILQF
jgi:hypothetical protein